jgi:hypothetical protein
MEGREWPRSVWTARSSTPWLTRREAATLLRPWNVEVEAGDAGPLAQLCHSPGHLLGGGRPLGPEEVDGLPGQLPEEGEGQGGEGHHPLPRPGLGLLEEGTPPHPHEGAADMEEALPPVHVAPGEAQQLPQPHARREGHPCHYGEGVAPLLDGLEEATGLLGWRGYPGATADDSLVRTGVSEAAPGTVLRFSLHRSAADVTIPSWSAGARAACCSCMAFGAERTIFPVPGSDDG